MKNGAGSKTIIAGQTSVTHTHNLGHTNYVVLVTGTIPEGVNAYAAESGKQANSFTLDLDVAQMVDVKVNYIYEET